MNKSNLTVEYKKNEDFNSEDWYVFEDWRLFISKVHKHTNGFWYTNESLQFKATSIQCVNFNDIKDRRVKIMDTKLEEDDRFCGTVWKCLTPLDLGIGWDKGKKKFMPTFWTNINDLEFLD